MMYQDSVHVPVPFVAVRDRLRGVHHQWFELAAQSAIEQGEQACRVADPTGAPPGPPSRVHVGTGRPSAGGSVYAVPFQWRIDGPEGSWRISGELEASAASPTETEIGLILRWDDADRDTARRSGAAEVVRAFLACVSLACAGVDRHDGQHRSEVALTAPGGHRLGRWRRHR